MSGEVSDDQPLESLNVSIGGVIGSLTATVDADGRFSVTTSYPLLLGFVTFQAQDSGGLLSSFVWMLVM